jgi:hypothetical protein
MKTLRYIAIIPTAIVVWITIFFVGNYSLGLSAEYFCPEGFGSGRECYAPFWAKVERGFYIFWAGVSAFLVVLSSVVVAPSDKLRVGFGAYTLGVVIAISLAYNINAWWELLSAVLMGIISLVLATKYLTRKGK